METLQPACYEFYRANYIIKPSLDKSTDTVLLTLNEGDIVLVVSVESSGWAYGIALDSGARGWIPTNYCERFAPALIHDLLKTLSRFLSVCEDEYSAETLADFDQKIKTTAAEIRRFLDNAHCLTRESALVRTNEGLRHCRKRLLTNLSRLAKSVKGLASPQTPESTQLNDILLKVAASAFDTVDALNNIKHPAVAPPLPLIEESSGTDGGVPGEKQAIKHVFALELLHNNEGQIGGGTLRALVERLTDDSLSGQTLIPIFFHTFRFFTSPSALAKTLTQRFDTAAEDPGVVVPARELVHQIFEKWLGSYWRTSDHEALPVIERFSQEKLSRILPVASHELLVLTRAIPSLPVLSIRSNLPASNAIAPTADSFWMNGDKRQQITDFDPLEFAQQLTIRAMIIFHSIKPEELLEPKWILQSFKPKATNVAAMLALSMDMGKLVANTILENSTNDKERIVTHWIKIAFKCSELGNYASVMSIVSSIKSLFPVKYNRSLQTLFELLDPDKQYAVLRQVIHDHELPCVPAIEIYIVHLNSVRKHNIVAGELINYHSEGMHFIDFQSARIIQQLQRFQTPHPFIEIPRIQAWIQTLITSIGAGQGRRVDRREKMFLAGPSESLRVDAL